MRKKVTITTIDQKGYMGLKKFEITASEVDALGTLKLFGTINGNRDMVIAYFAPRCWHSLICDEA